MAEERYFSEEISFFAKNNLIFAKKLWKILGFWSNNDLNDQRRMRNIFEKRT